VNSHRFGHAVAVATTIAALPVLSLHGQVDHVATDTSGVEITHIANEGFLIAGGGRRVLVDALFSSGVQGYPTIPADILSNLEAGEAPFDRIDLVLATHHHADHFDAAMVARYLERFPDAHFVSTEQAVERFREAARSRPDLMARARGVMPPDGQRIQLEPGGIGLTVLNLHHGRDRSPPVQNLGFIIEVGGMKLLHVGDTEADARDFAPHGIVEEAIDVALLPSWFLTYEKWRRVVTESIVPSQILVMHLPRADAPQSWFGKSRNLEGLKRDILRAFPDAVFFDRPGHVLGFPPRTVLKETSE
jgi:L-ascorbate metabolism protein UlaG (beta-lactamase superfamily)